MEILLSDQPTIFFVRAVIIKLLHHHSRIINLPSTIGSGFGRWLSHQKFVSSSGNALRESSLQGKDFSPSPVHQAQIVPFVTHQRRFCTASSTVSMRRRLGISQVDCSSLSRCLLLVDLRLPAFTDGICADHPMIRFTPGSADLAYRPLPAMPNSPIGDSWLFRFRRSGTPAFTD
ncbi:unnamed protein product [Linum tenue]|uniref:Uncharacterized protein n=1 Tax=Linum tenue TaxID=586396 RepID=A0AAV0HUG6_9ROSI|nr:unnamed protein product [Linum tenue]